MSGAVTVAAAVALFLAGAAAVFDWRKRRVPDALTLPVLVGAPIAFGLAEGLRGVLHAGLGAAACAFVPLLLARRGAMGGGDVKLLAALGALLGYTLGVEAQLYAFLGVSIHALAQRARAGELRALGSAVGDAMRRSFRRGEAGQVDRETMRPAPLAPYVAGGVLLTLGLELLLAS